MRGPLEIDPARLDAGPATPGIYGILMEWAAIDWFAPANAPAQLARELFTTHRSAARVHTPKLFAENVDIEFSSGSWEHFSALCSRVRIPTSWDWKFGVLKILSREHAKACGWSLQNEESLVQRTEDSSGTLFYGIGDHIIWKSLSPTLDFSMLSKEHAECASFYLSYASVDVSDAVQWQLAERHGSIAGNPFVSLLRCYAAGFYPFAISATSVVMFSFDGPS